MAFGGNVPHFDTVYQRVCLQLSHARLAVGGDSHARNTVWKIEGILGTQQYRGGLSTLRGNRGLEHFAVGGVTAARYIHSAQFNSLKNCSAEVVLLHLGGNDLDARLVSELERRTSRRKVMRDILTLIRELENLGKVVYFLEIPTRFSRRERRTVEEMQEDVKYCNFRLKKLLKGRFIPLPCACFKVGAFHRSFYNRPRDNMIMEERVHFLDEVYQQIAHHVLQKIDSDMVAMKTPPSKIQLRLCEDREDHQ